MPVPAAWHTSSPYHSTTTLLKKNKNSAASVPQTPPATTTKTNLPAVVGLDEAEALSVPPHRNASGLSAPPRGPLSLSRAAAAAAAVTVTHIYLLMWRMGQSN